MEVFVLLWVGLALLVGVLTGKRGRGSGTWFVLAVLISPLLAGVLLAASKDVSENSVSAKTHRDCPACAEKILRAAVKCKHCCAEVKPEFYEETTWDKLTKMR